MSATHKSPKAMTATDFATLGLEDFVYILPATIDGKSVFAIQTAAGKTVGVAESRADAEAAAFANDMTTVAVH